MMHRLVLAFLSCFIIFVSGCVNKQPPATPLNALSSHEKIHFHSRKTAVVHLNTGSVTNYLTKSHQTNSAKRMANELNKVFTDAPIRAKHDVYGLRYDHNKQLRFTTSFINNLKKQHAFKHVIYRSDDDEVYANEVNIWLDFEKTDVGPPKKGNPVSLEVKMRVHDGSNHHLVRHYKIQSPKNKSQFNNVTLAAQLESSSQILLDTMLRDLDHMLR